MALGLEAESGGACLCQEVTHVAGSSKARASRLISAEDVLHLKLGSLLLSVTLLPQDLDDVLRPQVGQWGEGT